jgi:hypothetical protein
LALTSSGRRRSLSEYLERNTTTAAPVEFYFRPPGTTGSQDVLFERDVLGASTARRPQSPTSAYEHHYAAYFQDRWKPSPRISIKAGVRVENNKIFTQDRETVLGALLASGVPTNVADEEFHQWVTMPNFGIAYNAERWGVFRGTANRGYEWLDLGGGDGTSHAPYVLATDVFRANPRTSATLNQSLPGGFPLGLNFGGTPDDSIHNGRTYVNEFSGSWEHRLPHSSSFSTTFVLRRSWDYQSGDDLNVVRNQTTGALVGRPFPQYDTIRNTYNPNYTWQEQRSLQFLYTRNFVGRWGMNANYWTFSRRDSARGGIRRPTRRSSTASVLRTPLPTADGAAPSRTAIDLRQPAVRNHVLGVLHLYRRTLSTS